MSAIAWPNPQTQWAIQVTDLCKHYGRRSVLERLSLHVPRGGVHGLLGPNGSGKTTVIRILLGLVRATSGHVRILGQEIPQALPEVIGQIGAVVESPKFALRVSGRRNLEVLAISIGVNTRTVTEVLLEVGLADDADRDFGTYSLGMKQRLAIAATLLKSPEVLIFDEPTNGLDPVGIHDIRTTMRALADAGRTVLVSSHILSEVEQTADSVSIIAQGRIVAEGPMRTLLDGENPAVYAEVDRRTEATDVLRAAGWRVETRGDGLLIHGQGAATDPAAVAETLGRAELWPRVLTVESRDLEDVFLGLTKGRDLTSTQGRRREVA